MDKVYFAVASEEHDSQNFSASRIDMFMIPVAVTDQVNSCEIIPGIYSDHSIIVVEFKFNDLTRGPGVWRLNTQLLDNPKYVKQTNELLDQMELRYPTLNPNDFWIQLKNDCAMDAKSFSKTKVENKKKEKINLENTLSRLYIELDRAEKSEDTEKINLEITSLKERLTVLDMEKVEASIFRSKCKYVNEYEKSTKFFFSLEKQRYLEKNMKCLVTDSGRVLTEPKDILKGQTEYYQKLYETNKQTKFNLSPETNEQLLTEEQKQFCDQPLIMDEIFDAIMTLKKGKCCGGDGLPVEWYLKILFENQEAFIRYVQLLLF